MKITSNHQNSENKYPVIIRLKKYGFLVIFKATLVVLTMEFEIISNMKKAKHISNEISIGAWRLLDPLVKVIMKFTNMTYNVINLVISSNEIEILRAATFVTQSK
mmetsp:Transcript_12044/g.11691  ORF Transcript_12044/g.11691 Transcript_12044/m.11691 type:complete len:105 (+) Transcript_12044:903-1217(+)